MPMKVKGLLKGLRYILHIVNKKKEQELQIGFPMDVKHIAHIGWEGPSANALSWLSKFDSTPQLKLQLVDPLEEPQTDAQDSLRRLLSKGFGSPQSSSYKHASSATKHLRRHCKSAASTDARTQGSSHTTPSHDPAMVSKQLRERKSKGSSGGGSTRTLRSKGQSPLNDASSLTEHGLGSKHGQGLKKIQSHLSTVTQVSEEGKG
ncbi:hypothetical protein ACJRO7_031795 [Eucalyptus globulus]|uniref:CRIB domain-containing protein n=1 Tax=Eucalyptus globulus TaxID=34317 RepID=A0ABD3JIG7_EUCGL